MLNGCTCTGLLRAALAFRIQPRCCGRYQACAAARRNPVCLSVPRHVVRRRALVRELQLRRGSIRSTFVAMARHLRILNSACYVRQRLHRHVQSSIKVVRGESSLCRMQHGHEVFGQTQGTFAERRPDGIHFHAYEQIGLRWSNSSWLVHPKLVSQTAKQNAARQTSIPELCFPAVSKYVGQISLHAVFACRWRFLTTR